MKWLVSFIEKLSCKHQWNLEKSIDVHSNYKPNDIPYSLIYMYKCTICGNFKKVRIP